jgi:hypothetical protein
VSAKRWRVLAQVGTVDLTNAVRASSSPLCRNGTDPKRYLIEIAGDPAGLEPATDSLEGYDETL